MSYVAISPRGFRGFGAMLSTGVTFDPAAVWSKWAAGGASANAAAKLIQVGLNDLGAGIKVTSMWDSASRNAFLSIVGTKFDFGMTPTAGKAALSALAAKLDAKAAAAEPGMIVTAPPPPTVVPTTEPLTVSPVAPPAPAPVLVPTSSVVPAPAPVRVPAAPVAPVPKPAAVPATQTTRPASQVYPAGSASAPGAATPSASAPSGASTVVRSGTAPSTSGSASQTTKLAIYGGGALILVLGVLMLAKKKGP